MCDICHNKGFTDYPEFNLGSIKNEACRAAYKNGWLERDKTSRIVECKHCKGTGTCQRAVLIGCGGSCSCSAYKCDKCGSTDLIKNIQTTTYSSTPFFVCFIIGVVGGGFAFLMKDSVEMLGLGTFCGLVLGILCVLASAETTTKISSSVVRPTCSVCDGLGKATLKNYD